MKMRVEGIKREIDIIRSVAMDFLSSVGYIPPSVVEPKTPPEVLHVMYRAVALSSTAMATILNAVARIERLLQEGSKDEEKAKEGVSGGSETKNQ